MDQEYRSCAIRHLGTLGLGIAIAFAVSGARPSAQAGGIEVLAANTLFDQGTRVSLTHIYDSKGTLLMGSDEVANPTDLSFEEHRLVAGVDHGLRPDLTVSALLPFVSQELASNTGDLESAGLGDLALLAKYRIHKEDWKRSTFQVAVIGGIQVPTGETGARDQGIRLPPPLQPGLGSWNPFFGMSSVLSLDRYRFDAVAFYKLNTEGAQDWEQGDFLALEVDAAYRFLHRKYPGATASARLGLAWRHEGQAQLEDATVINSGSDLLLLRPGLSWHPAPNVDVSLTIDVPLYQDVEGVQLGLDYRTFLAVGIRF